MKTTFESENEKRFLKYVLENMLDTISLRMYKIYRGKGRLTEHLIDVRQLCLEYIEDPTLESNEVYFNKLMNDLNPY